MVIKRPNNINFDKQTIDNIILFKRTNNKPNNLTDSAFLKFRAKINQLSLLDNKLFFNNRQIIAKENINYILTTHYKDPIIGLVGMNRFYDKLKNLYIGISKNDVSKFLKHNKNWQLHQQPKKIGNSKSIVTSKPNNIFSFDLIDMSKEKYNNNNITFLLTMIDAFSKKLYVFPLQNKEAKSIVNILKEFFDNNKKNIPNIIISDNGSEFKNDLLNLYLKNIGVKQVFGLSYNPIGLIERVNKTLKELIYKYMSNNNTKNYIDVLNKLIENYNSSIHTTTKIAPNDVTNNIKQNKEIHKNIKDVSNKLLAKNNKQLPMLNKNDYVRISLQALPENRKNKYKKSTNINWTNDVFKVNKRIMNTNPSIKDRYKLNKISGLYYRNELLLVPDYKDKNTKNNEYDVEKILDHKRIGSRIHYLVKWKSFDDEHNTWEPISSFNKNNEILNKYKSKN